MKAAILLALTGLSIMSARAAEPKGTLTLACEGTKKETMPRIAGEEQTAIALNIVMDFGARTVTGFPLPPVCDLDQPVISEITDTTISYKGCSPSDLTVTYSFLGTFDRKTGAAEASFTTAGDLAWTRNFALKCKASR